MPADFSSGGLTLVSWGATYLVHSTCLVAGVWLFLRIRSSSGHALRETLWKMALIGGIATTSVQLLLAPPSPFGSLIFAIGDARQPVIEDTPTEFGVNKVSEIVGEQSISNQRPSLETEPTDNLMEDWIARASAGPGTSGVAVDAQPTAVDSVVLPVSGGIVGNWLDHLRMTWAMAAFVAAAFIAVAVGLGRCLWQSLSLRRRLTRCSPIDEGLPRLLLDELRAMVPRVPEVLLLSAPDDPEPAAFGVRRWTIVLPRRAADLPAEDLRALLAHELAHLVRGDSLWLWISRIVCSCLAFQPLNQLARREWQRAAEFLCDNWAVSQTGAPLALARCLTEVAGWRLSGRASEALLAATGRKSGLVDRIERLLDARPAGESWNGRREQRRVAIAGGFVLALLVWCAPRVQVALAEGESVNSTQYTVPSQDAAEARVVALPQSKTSETQPAPDGEKERNKPVELTDSQEPAVSTNAGPRAVSPMELSALLKSLDRDLTALENELEALEPLLSNVDAAPVAVSTVERLRRDMTRLKQRRAALLTFLESVGRLK